ncbi:MAG: ATP-binding protein [Planctomycetota bacterium]|jgi:ATP-dependent DNA helicase RecG
MNRSELAELIRNGENSGIDFKRDDLAPEKLAKVAAALLNLEGGHILLGVEDDGAVSGLTRERGRAEEWVMQVLRDHLQPGVIPYWETIDWGEGKLVGIVTLSADAPDKPYKVKRGSGAWVTQVRVGSTTRDATREEEARLYMQSGQLQQDRKPVVGSTLADLDLRRLINYFRDIRGQDCPESSDNVGWERLLVNTEIMYGDRGRAIPSVGGLLLFGNAPNRHLAQAGITAVAYPGTQKDYAAQGRELLRGPLVSLFREGAAGSRASGASVAPAAGLVEVGVIDMAMDFVRRHTHVTATLDGARRNDRWDYPEAAVREAIVNAVAHRDYTILGIDVDLAIFADRLEITSPGRLPNTVTVDKMRAGYRASRNELVKEVLRDYRYIEATGLGVPRKIVAGMREHNGTDPDLVEEDSRFVVRLWKHPPAP